MTRRAPILSLLPEGGGQRPNRSATQSPPPSGGRVRVGALAAMNHAIKEAAE